MVQSSTTLPYLDVRALQSHVALLLRHSSFFGALVTLRNVGGGAQEGAQRTNGPLVTERWSINFDRRSPNTARAGSSKRDNVH